MSKIALEFIISISFLQMTWKNREQVARQFSSSAGSMIGFTEAVQLPTGAERCLGEIPKAPQ